MCRPRSVSKENDIIVSLWGYIVGHLNPPPVFLRNLGSAKVCEQT